MSKIVFFSMTFDSNVREFRPADQADFCKTMRNCTVIDFATYTQGGYCMKRMLMSLVALAILLPLSMHAQAKKYGLKSGVITYSTETMGTKVKGTLFFDDFGKVECLETVFEMDLGDTKEVIHNRVLTKDGFTYTFDIEKKTGTKRRISGSQSSGQYDFSTMSDNMKKEYQVKELGTEKFLGRECKRFSMNNKDMEMKGTFLIWNNIPLKSETNAGGMDMKMIATKVEENGKIPTGMFEVPKDIVIK